MTHAGTTRFLHVANGSSTTSTIEAAGIPGTLSIWADPLYEGPVPGALSDAELIDVRARYLSGSVEPAPIDDVNDLRRWRKVIERHESYDELILWFEHDLFDQLNLVQVLTFIRGCVPAAKAVSLVCIGSFPGRPAFRGLGELTPGELAPLIDARRPVTPAQYALAEQVWREFREPSPEALDARRQQDTSAFPFLAAALKRFLEEYPSIADGLSRSERRLLQLLEGGPMRLAAAFPRMHEDEDAYYLTDLSFADLVDTLARSAPPLVTVTRDEGGRIAFRASTVTLTDVGRTVLTGERDRIALCGIDRWLGGVHLQGDRDIWRWDDQRQRMTNSSKWRMPAAVRLKSL